jgi:hypothetical protein
VFNLEKQISDWRKQMLAAGIASPVPLEELESHLREDILEQMHMGRSEQDAFEICVKNIGQPWPIKKEFAKTERNYMKQMIKIGAGVIGLMVGMAFVMPAVAQSRHDGAMTSDEVVLYTLGMAMCAGSIYLAFIALKKRKA